MATLMVHAGWAAGEAAVTRSGGVPLAPAGFSWPACGACEAPMQVVAQVMLGDLGLDDWRGVLWRSSCARTTPA